MAAHKSSRKSQSAAPAQITTPGLVIRFSEPADQQVIFDFYQENRHKHVDVRKAAVWNERARNGRVILLHDREDHIGFVSVAYDFNGAAKGAARGKGRHMWTELGSTMNQQNPAKKPYQMLKGITPYPFIIASQTVNEFLCHTPEDKIIANVYDDNGAVIHMLSQRAGWHEFEPEDDILKACKATKSDSNSHGALRRWFNATTDTLPHQARLVLDMVDQGRNPGLYNKKTQDFIPLDSSRFSLAGRFRPAVEALAHGPLADYLEQSPHIGMKKARQHLDHYLKHKTVPTVKPGKPDSP